MSACIRCGDALEAKDICLVDPYAFTNLLICNKCLGFYWMILGGLSTQTQFKKEEERES